MSENLRQLTPEQLLSWTEDRSGVMRVNTDRDILPGGYMAALSPLLVSWPASDISPGLATVTMRNLNYGGNPFERITVLRSLRFSLEAVEAAELILVPFRRLKRRAPVYHVQVRFIFERGAEPVLLDLADATTGTDARVPDLVLSWETWRAPDTPLDLKAALGGRGLALSLRAYAGAQRYLEDMIHECPWHAYRLRLPGGRRGVRELLGVSLTLGDSVARETLSGLLDAGEQSWLDKAPGGNRDATLQRWRDLKARLPRETSVEDRLARLPPGEKTYNALLRSCATVSRYLILLAAHRLMQRGEGGEYDVAKLPELRSSDTPVWMSEAASGDLLGIFMRAPAVLRFLLGHPESRPDLLPDALDAAGLLEHRDGERVAITYARNATRPYGPDGLRRDS